MSNGQNPRLPTRKEGIAPEGQGQGGAPDNWEDPFQGHVEMELPNAPEPPEPDTEGEGRPDPGIGE